MSKKTDTGDGTGNGRSDEELIRRVLDGDTDAFRQLVERHQSMIYALIMRQVGDETVAKELTQETFIRASTGLKRFRFKSRFSTWLTRIALNRTNSYFTSSHYRNSLKHVALDPVMLYRTHGNPEDIQIAKELIEHLKAFLGTLKPKYRNALVLYYLEGKSYQETAAILDVPVGTISSRINTAILQLRKKFERVT